MARTDNLILFTEMTPSQHSELSRRGQKASVKARKEKATMKKTLELMLEIKDKQGLTNREKATMGLLKGAVKGDPRNYKTILEVLGEINGNDKQAGNGVIDDLIEALNDVKKNK